MHNTRRISVYYPRVYLRPEAERRCHKCLRILLPPGSEERYTQQRQEGEIDKVRKAQISRSSPVFKTILCLGSYMAAQQRALVYAIRITTKACAALRTAGKFCFL